MSRIKHCIVPASDNHILLEIDYSQLEVVVLAWLSRCKELVNDLNSGIDMHCKILAKELGKTYETIYDLYKKGNPTIEKARKNVKRRTFLLIYGGGAKALASQTGITEKEAKRFIDTWYAAYPGVKLWHAQAQRDVYGNQYTREGNVFSHYTNFLGTRFTFKKKPSDYSKSGMAFYATEVKNYPVQGTAAEIVKTALAILPAALEAEFTSDQVVLHNTVHDSFIMSVEKGMEYQVAGYLEYVLTDLVIEVLCDTYGIEREKHFIVPLAVDAEVGPDWDNMESLVNIWEEDK